MHGFHGSYLSNDVTFLLKRINIESTSIEAKEKLIQSGKRHYSEMITKESLPTTEYTDLFYQSVKTNGATMARDIYRMATYIKKIKKGGEITLVSLARAGTPVGVLVKRVLDQLFDIDAPHYSISIIRDRGVDSIALKHILTEGHTPESIVFIDGWTGKGVISRELSKTITDFNHEHKLNIDDGLYVLNDLAGTAAWSSSDDDYLIPSSILNATVSGLISRSILNTKYMSAEEFHGCFYYSEFESSDRSLWFAGEIMQRIVHIDDDHQPESDATKNARAMLSQEFMADMKRRFDISDINLIKPGIGESTRVMLRRVPDLLLVKDPTASCVKHLLVLAHEKGIPVVTDANLLYNAVALIKEVD